MRQTGLQRENKRKRQQLNLDKLTFPVFFSAWASLNGWEVPAFHWQVCQFLDNDENWRHFTAVLEVFRGAGKSTIVGLYIVYRLVKDPTLRFLVLSADDRSATRISNDCRSIITRHPWAKHLRGKDTEWKQHRFTVVGATDARNPSVSAHGITSNITSARADIIVYDDVETPKTSSNEEARYHLRQKLQESTHILVPRGKKLYIGTPHSYESIYPEIVAQGCSSLVLPLIINPTGEFPEIRGQSRWPERFDQEDITRRQRTSKKGNFLSQYQLIAVDVEDSFLDPAEVRTYGDEIEFSWAQGQQQAYIGDTRLAGVSAFWDPALAGRQRKGDSSVLAIVYSDTAGHYYIHRLISLHGDPDEQCGQVRDAALKWRVPVVQVETNGIGAFLPQVLLKHVRGLGIGVDGIYTSVKKEKKILEALETPLYAGALHIHEEVLKTPFIEQLRDFNPYKSAIHDDFIDAPASAIQAGPIRIGRGSALGGPVLDRWGEHSGAGDIEVDMARLT